MSRFKYGYRIAAGVRSGSAAETFAVEDEVGNVGSK